MLKKHDVNIMVKIFWWLYIGYMYIEGEIEEKLKKYSWHARHEIIQRLILLQHLVSNVHADLFHFHPPNSFINNFLLWNATMR